MQIEPKRLCDVEIRGYGFEELFSMKTLQHWPLHLPVFVASKAGWPNRIRTHKDAPLRWPRQPLRTENSERRMRFWMQ